MIPDELDEAVKPGVMVTVQFGGRKIYIPELFAALHDNQPDFKNIKSILSVTDKIPLINEHQLKLWLWISEYYLCSEGEVMKAALPSEISLSTFKPRLETYIKLSRKYSEDELNEILNKLEKAPRQQEVLSHT